MKLVYVSPVPWQSISQRPHFFAKAALDNGIDEVLWIDPYPSRLPNLGDLSPGRHAPEPQGMPLLPRMKVIKPGFIVPCEPYGFLFDNINRSKLMALHAAIDSFRDSKTILTIGKPCSFALALCKNYKWHQMWFDAMDDFPSFYTGVSNRAMKRHEKKLSEVVDKILCSSHALLEKFSNTNKTQLIPNACSDQNVKCISNVSNQCFTFGYIGTLASWFDWDWLKNLSQLNQNSLIRLIGPVKGKIPFLLPTNILIEPPVKHSKVMSLLATFDATLIPFKQNKITNYVDPVKFYEYALAEKTIISTSFGEMPWHHKQFSKENLNTNFTAPKGSLIFPPIYNANEHVPRWNDRFSSLFE